MERGFDPPPIGSPHLLPTHELSDLEFEDFTERLLNAQKFLTSDEHRVVRVDRYGRRGDPQDGIDFEGAFRDGRTADWQCKRYREFLPGDVRKAVAALNHDADVHHLVLSCEASTAVRREMRNHVDWVLLDKRALGRLVDDLPLHKRRDVLDATWGRARRRQLMASPGQDLFISLDSFVELGQDATKPLNDRGPLMGRTAALETLDQAMDRRRDWPGVVLLSGPGGRGKSRLLREGLQRAQLRDPRIPIVVLAPNMPLGSSAMADLPGQPAVVVVDDAHADPSSLGLLVTYAAQVPETQLVVSFRPTSADAVRNQFTTFAPSDVLEVDLGQLSGAEATRLVEGLVQKAGLDASWDLVSYLAGQARHSPHVAVITVNLIASGDLQGPLAVDSSLRERVLGRYFDVTAGIDGSASELVRRTLAVYAALAGIDDGDLDTRRLIATAVGVDVAQLLTITAALRTRGVLVRSHGTRVAPEILGDDALERVSSIDNMTTGFVDMLWEIFSTGYGMQLILSVTDLDWRLSQQGQSPVGEVIWQHIRTGLLQPSLSRTQEFLSRVTRLAITRPDRFLPLLEELRHRLDGPESPPSYSPGNTASATNAPDATASDIESEPDRLHDPDSRKEHLGLAPIGPSDIRRLLARAYGHCAQANPHLLEPALDALWALARVTHDHTNEPDHPVRVVADRLADLGNPPDPSFPERIVARVRDWLRTPGRDDDLVTPLFPLNSLVVKQGMQIRQARRHEIQLHGYLIRPESVRVLRDEIRSLLAEVAVDVDLRRASIAVELLGTLMREPHANNTVQPSLKQILAWENDDIATMESLTTAARTTGSAVIRRRIREEITWESQRARSPHVRHAAMTLLAELDSRPEDDLFELLLHGWHVEESWRDRDVPSLKSTIQETQRELSAEANMTPDQRDATTHREAERTVALHRSSERDLQDAIITGLIELSDESLVAQVDSAACEVRAARTRQAPLLWALINQLGADIPDRVPGIVREILSRPPGGLDTELRLLLAAWARNAPDSLSEWLGDLARHPEVVSLAVAQCFEQFGWSGIGPLRHLYELGISHEDEATRLAFQQAGAFLLRASPGPYARQLLASAASPWMCVHLIQEACRYQGIEWGASIEDADVGAVLDLIERAGLHEYVVQQVLAGIASRHPFAVLDHLGNQEFLWRRTSNVVAGLPEALENGSPAVAAWLLERAPGLDPLARRSVLDVAIPRMGPQVATALEDSVERLSSDELLALCRSLQDITFWPVNQSLLARAVVVRARSLDVRVADDMDGYLRSAMIMRSYGFSNGVSDEVERGRELLRAAADSENEAYLREVFCQSLRNLDQVAERLLRDDAEEEQE